MTLRRDFLGFTAGAVAAMTVLQAVAHAKSGKLCQSASSPHPDAELIQLRAQFLTAWAAQDAFFAVAVDPSDKAVAAVCDPVCDLVERIAAIPARTLDGLTAQATALDCLRQRETITTKVFCDWGLPNPTTEKTLAVSMLQTLVGMTTGRAAI